VFGLLSLNLGNNPRVTRGLLLKKVSPKPHSGPGNSGLMNLAVGYQSDWPLATC
jgi:hypothetical protein